MQGFVIVYMMKLISIYRAGAFITPFSSWSKQHPTSPRTPTTNTMTLSRPIEFRDSRYFTRSNFRVAGEYSERENGGNKPPSAHRLPLKSVLESRAGVIQLCRALKSSRRRYLEVLSTSDAFVSADRCFRAIEVAGETERTRLLCLHHRQRSGVVQPLEIQAVQSNLRSHSPGLSDISDNLNGHYA
jgi:hypothetical protein